MIPEWGLNELPLNVNGGNKEFEKDGEVCSLNRARIRDLESQVTEWLAIWALERETRILIVVVFVIF